MTKKFWINQNLKSKLIKIIWIILVLLVMIIWITIAKNQSGINPHSKKIAELSFELNELETHKRICLDNLSYKESIDNEKGIHSHCVAYDERIMAVSEEIERLKSWDWEEEVKEEKEEKEREPWQLNASWDAQEMPKVEAKTSHDRFKELAQKYWLNPSTIWEVENKHNLREALVLCVIIAETSWGKAWYWKDWCWNFWNVGNNDRGNRRCYWSEQEWLDAIGRVLNNKYLGKIQTLWCLSNAGSCQDWDNTWHRYATSNGNRERTVTSCLNTIYSEELWKIDPKTFNVRRTFIQYQ